MSLFACSLAAMVAPVTASAEHLVPVQAGVRKLLVSAPQLFGLAEEARRRGDIATATNALGALATDPDVKIRSEARFRLAQMLVAGGQLSNAALLFRQILDDQPKAHRVRLELARTLELIGDESGARKTLREAQAGGLPPAVARLVDRYSAALRGRKPMGASLEIAFAPDSNINRATRSDTLGTVLGDFALEEDARERSGTGMALRGQAYARLPVSERMNILGRASGTADLYRGSRFNDIGLNVAVGPEISLGRHRLNAEAGATWRWYGMEPYSTSVNLGLSYLLPLDSRSQARASAGVSVIDNKRNRLQDGRAYSMSLSYERAVSETMGAGVRLDVERQALRDPGYSTRAVQLGVFAYRDLGPTTLFATLGYGGLRADERLFIYPETRSDTVYRASLGATFRRFQVGGFAPVVRVIWERNRSNIEVFEYQRRRTEFGIARAL